MSKAEFLKKLNRRLYRLRRNERKKYLSDYEELISELMENGMTEEEAIWKLGDGKQIAREILDHSEKRFAWIDWKGKGLIGISFLLIIAALVCYKGRQGIVLHLKGGDGPTSVFLAGRISNGMWIYLLAGMFVGVTAWYLFWKRKSG